ncbi:MAG: 6-bladed beta-propeller [Deltaproteobacteria bacterium]|nr:6-bladed beta-propeller [Deltaproteobacteria bacterium]MDZ4346088.1 6-bladed beta-propeller [Candidatus Binatia bacterium]
MNSIRLIFVYLLLALASGCASSQGLPKELSAAGPILVWPLPPEDPRIQYVSSVASPEDLGISKGFFRKVFEFFFGKTDERIQQPYGVTADSDGRIYIADSALRVVHVFDMPEQKYWSIRGTNREEFQFPLGVTVDRERRLYVSDAERKAVIGFDRGGTAFMTITEGLQRPAGLAFNAMNNLLYVVDVVRHEVLAYDLKGKLMFTFGGRGTEKARLNFPTNIAIDREGRVYISDAMNFRVQIFQSDGTFISNFGRLGDAVGDLARPKGIGIDSDGHIYLVEGLYDVVNIFDREGQLMLTFGNAGVGRGEFWLATGIFVDAKDRIYVADSYNSRVQIFQYLRSGG